VGRQYSTIGRRARLIAWGLALSFVSPLLAGCGRGDNNQPTEATRGSRTELPPVQERKPGLSTRQKVAILAGAAALYYLYKKHKNEQGKGAQGQYYLSKNGRVYYRDQNGNPVWVTPPPGGIEVPASEAEQYSRYQGYNGRSSGETFGGYGAGAEPVAGGPPGPPGPGR
jgi:hypothetical protein